MQVKIFGERHTATNALSTFIEANFHSCCRHNDFLGWKHRLAPLAAEWKRVDHDNTLFVITVRNPYTWLRSMHRQPYFFHQPWAHKRPIDAFLSWPVEDYENVIALWNQKYQSYRRLLAEVPHSTAVRMEQFLENPREVYDHLSQWLRPRGPLVENRRYMTGYGDADSADLAHATRLPSYPQSVFERINGQLDQDLVRYFGYQPYLPDPPPRIEVKARPPRILFASYHCLADPASGAALSTRDTLCLLARHGWQTRVFSGPQMDRAGVSAPQVVQEQRLPARLGQFREGTTAFSMLDYRQDDLQASVFLPEGDDDPAPEHVAAFRSLYERLLRDWQPDVLLTYGGQWVGSSLMDDARNRGIRVVFGLHNLSYDAADLFEPADAVVVPSRFCADHYRQALQLDCEILPNPLIWSHVRYPQSPRPEYITFVNPQPGKGVTVVARIADELAKRRPEIPILVVEARGGVDWLAQCGVDLSHANLQYMNNTTDPRMFYSVSRIVLMPSLFAETYGRVAVEAMINGLPLLASNRGALPEVVGDGGLLFDIPEQYTPSTPDVPTAEEIQPWIETILRLWDDQAYSAEASERALARAEFFREDRIAQRYDDFLRRLVGQA